MKRTVSVATVCILLLSVFVFMLSACGGPSDEELAQMYEQAKTYEKNANFDLAFKTYEKLYDYKYPDEDYPFKTLDEAFQTRQDTYTVQMFLCEEITWMVASLKRDLINPKSLLINRIEFKTHYSDENVLDINIDYSAQNKAGGMARKTKVFDVEFQSKYTNYISDHPEVRTALNRLMDNPDATDKQRIKYIINECNKYFDSQSVYDAFVSETVSY